MDQLVALPDQATLEAQLRGPLTETIVQRWRDRVLDDVRARPFTDEERTRARAPLDGDPLISYGCTLLLAVLTPSWVGLLQIGDGDVTVVRGSTVESPVPDDDRLVGGETTSLCLPTAVADVRVHVVSEPLPDTLILTTDGYANSFADPNWRTHAGIDLRDQIHRTGLDAVETRLPAWLADSASAGGDDVSMALIQRVDAAAVAAVARTCADSGSTGGDGGRCLRHGSRRARRCTGRRLADRYGNRLAHRPPERHHDCRRDDHSRHDDRCDDHVACEHHGCASGRRPNHRRAHHRPPRLLYLCLHAESRSIVFSDGRVLIFDPEQAAPTSSAAVRPGAVSDEPA